MAGELTFRLSSTVLEWARTSMGYTIEQAARKAGVPSDKFAAWEKGEKSPTYKQLETLAERVYKRPLAVLLLKSPPTEDPIQKDFRNLSNSEIQNLSPEVRMILRKAKRYQLILEEVTQKNENLNRLPFKLNLKDDPTEAARSFRHAIGLSLKEQRSWTYERAFHNFKSKIEGLGIFVFQFKMPMSEARAFCLSGDFPIIVLNTDDSTNGRIFSLFHETCHILFNTNGIFRDTETGKLNKEYADIEKFCNQFAASFLVPEEAFSEEVKYRSSWDEHDIQRIARSFNVSAEVIARKLLLRKLISEDFFWTKKRYWDSLAIAAKERQNEASKEHEGGRAQDIRIIQRRGSHM
jgi:Zn-dependent peptidase ImmA (M78 family)